MSFIHINPINLGRNLILLAIAIIEILFGFSIFNKVFSYFEADMENTYLQKQISTNLYYYSNIKNKSNKLKRFRHDMKNHFVTISYLLEGGRIEEAKKYEGTYKIDTTENMFKISIILMDVF